MAKKKTQPWGVVLTCLLLVLSGLVLVVAGGTTMTAVKTTATGGAVTETITDPTGLMTYMPVSNMLTGISWLLIIVGLMFFAFAYLLWQHNELGWYGTLVFVGISLVLDVVQVAFYGLAVATPFLIGIAISIIILAVLFHKGVIRAVNPDIKYNGWSEKKLLG